MFLSCFHFSIRSPSSILFPFYVFQFRKASSSSPYLVFFLLPLEVNLHTYLTIWLSSCPVGIFSRSHTLIVKIQIINKVSSLKWATVKSTHIKFLEHLRSLDDHELSFTLTVVKFNLNKVNPSKRHNSKTLKPINKRLISCKLRLG